jgi:hypothetical protein
MMTGLLPLLLVGLSFLPMGGEKQDRLGSLLNPYSPGLPRSVLFVRK